MSREDKRCNYSVEVNYSVSTPLYNRIRNSEESIVVVDQPESLVSVVLSTNPQERDVEEVKFDAGKAVIQADYSNVDLDGIEKTLQSHDYNAQGPSFRTEIAGLKCEQNKPTMDDLMGE